MAETEGSAPRWAMEVLEKDEWFSQMTVADHRRIIGEAIKFGSHLAANTCEKLGIPSGADSVIQILGSLNCAIRIDDNTGLPGPLSLYEEDMCSALFFKRRIRDTASQSIERGEWHSGWYELYAQCVARELFHHTENTLSGKASHHIRIKDRLLALLPVSRPVETASEIACLVFVRDFLNLPDVPLLMRNV